MQLEETDADGNTKTFSWITPLRVTAKTVEAIATKGGRYRWKIENRTFNRQKNSAMNLTHLYSTDEEKLKSYYALLSIAFVMMQLLEQGSLLRHVAKEAGRSPWQWLGSLAAVGQLLLEGLRCGVWEPACFLVEAARKLRISFAAFMDTS